METDSNNSNSNPLEEPESFSAPRTPDTGRYSHLPTVPTLVPWKTKLTVPLRLKFFLTGVVFPVVCLTTIAFGWLSSMHTPWQSGNIKDYVVVLTSAPAIFAIFPLLLFSFVCLSRWCLWPHKSNSIWNWLGLFSGAILALIFTVLLCICTAIIGQLMAAFVMPILALLFFLVDIAIRKRLFRRQFSIKYVMVLTAVVASAFGVAKAAGVDAVTIVGMVIGFLGVVLLYVVGAAPAVGFVTFCRATVASAFLMREEYGQSVFGRSWAHRRKTIAGFVGWIAAFAASWKIAIDIMMIEYAKLPTTSPNCYVSSAAANGHPCLVGAYQLDAEKSIVINSQMQRLKFLEFALAASLPSLHQWIRGFYNKVGPSLARLCATNQWFSDLTFVALKPLEWVALLLARWIGVPQSEIDRIYCR